MSHAKQRFNSTAKPLQRIILLFRAIWQFCIDCKASRAGTEPGRAASQFLQAVIEEALFQAAMMAGGAEEGLRLRRFFDAKNWDCTGISAELHKFHKMQVA